MEIRIEAGIEAKEVFDEVVKENEELFLEESVGNSGIELISLVIENLPKYITATIAVVKLLNDMKIKPKIFKDEREITLQDLEKEPNSKNSKK